ncbi:hypothetical protein [Archangium primigenium]|uniref:hypothetical protein n=1 Tax=[Archangium] primigenium TaxID=2792470 RepID=UPI00195D5F28|nr:hypothetical protein [Archangium primigenium]MBM7114941.1 hypothetical protein [Archangium primigenium]
MSRRHLWSARAVTRNMGGLALLGVGLVGGQGWASPAGNEPPPKVRLTCVGSARTVFSPALSPTSQSGSMTLSSRYGGCLSMGGQGASWANVVTTTSAYQNFTCSDALGVASDTVTVTWSNGEQSVLSLQPSEVDEEATTTTVSYEGRVVSGRYQGLSVVRSLTYLNADFTTRCASDTGLPETNAFSLLVFAEVP